MPRSIRWVLWAAAAAWMLVASCLSIHDASAGEVVLRDDAGREIVVDRPPRRIVSLLPSLTETLCALDACALLVATDRFSNWPESVRALPKAGALDDAAIEAIVALKPDLVLISQSQRISERLQELGLRTFAVRTDTYADISRTVHLLGRILAVPERAAALVQSLDAQVAQVGAEARARGHGRIVDVYYEVDRAPYGAGPTSFIGELLTRLGTRNILAADLGPYPKINPEYVVRGDPEVIFVSAAEAPHLAERPGWATIRAVKMHRVCSFPPAVQDTIVRPGPRVAEGMRALAGCLERMVP